MRAPLSDPKHDHFMRKQEFQLILGAPIHDFQETQLELVERELTQLVELCLLATRLPKWIQPWPQ